MVKNWTKRTRFHLSDFEDRQDLVEEHLMNQLGSLPLMLWRGYNMWYLVHSEFFQLIRVGESKYTMIVQKFFDGQISVWVITQDPKKKFDVDAATRNYLKKRQQIYHK